MSIIKRIFLIGIYIVLYASPIKAMEERSAVQDFAASSLNGPEPGFPSIKEQSAWLAEMSRRLEKRMAERTERTEFLKTVYYEAKRAGLDPQLVLALIEELSDFNMNTPSYMVAKGYMKVRPKWVTMIGNSSDDLSKMWTNLRYGCNILRIYLDLENGDIYRALIHYNNDINGNDTNPIDEKDEVFPLRVRLLWEANWNWDQKQIPKSTRGGVKSVGSNIPSQLTDGLAALEHCERADTTLERKRRVAAIKGNEYIFTGVVTDVKEESEIKVRLSAEHYADVILVDDMGSYLNKNQKIVFTGRPSFIGSGLLFYHQIRSGRIATR